MIDFLLYTLRHRFSLLVLCLDLGFVTDHQEHLKRNCGIAAFGPAFDDFFFRISVSNSPASNARVAVQIHFGREGGSRVQHEGVVALRGC